MVFSITLNFSFITVIVKCIGFLFTAIEPKLNWLITWRGLGEPIEFLFDIASVGFGLLSFFPGFFHVHLEIESIFLGSS